MSMMISCIVILSSHLRVEHFFWGKNKKRLLTSQETMMISCLVIKYRHLKIELFVLYFSLWQLL